jgi:predicted dehydrogenase
VTAALKIAVVGAGFGQHVLVPALRSDPRVFVQAICASTEARARVIADRLEIPLASGDWRALVTDPRIDAVAISVPPALQCPMVLAAAAAGKHILAEKPLGSSAQEARDMLAAASAARVVGVVDFEFRELEGWQKVRALVGAGALGRLRQVYLSWRIETMANRDPKPSWKKDSERGGGTLNLFGSHALDSIVWTFGRVRRVAAQLLPSRSGGTAEARVEAWLELVDGLSVSLSIAADAPLGGGYRLEVYGDEGALVLENSTADYASGFSLAHGERGKGLRPIELAPLPEGTDGRRVATGGIVRRFVDAIRDGAPENPGLPSFQDGLEVQHLIDAIREANRRGAWQSLS